MPLGLAVTILTCIGGIGLDVSVWSCNIGVGFCCETAGQTNFLFCGQTFFVDRHAAEGQIEGREGSKPKLLQLLHMKTHA